MGQAGRGDGFVVEHGAVFRFQVFHRPAAIPAEESGMATRDAGFEQHNVAPFLATDDDFVLIEE
jgi:hypothetical protein